MKIVKIPNPILNKKTSQVFDFSKIKEISLEMLKIMEENNGVGLAGPQVDLPLSLFVASVTGKASDGIVFINPVIKPIGDQVKLNKEGCLSIPGEELPIYRYSNVSVSYQDINQKIVNITASGLLSRICQHESDHLNGILITDRYNLQCGL